MIRDIRVMRVFRVDAGRRPLKPESVWESPINPRMRLQREGEVMCFSV